MNGLPFERLPGDTPQDILRGNMQSAQKQVADQYNQQLKTLRETPMADKDFAQQYNKLAKSFQADVQKASQPFIQKSQQLQTIQNLIRQGHITAEKGAEAGWRVSLPQETERAMFPSAEGRPPAPFSPGQLKTYGELAAEFVGAAEKTEPVARWWRIGPFGRYKKPTKESLIRQYVGWQEQIGYANLPPVRQQQADIQWDDYVRGQDIEEWDPRDPEVMALRSKGRLTRAVARNVTPVGRTIIRAKETARERITPNIARQFLSEAGGDKDRARQIARSRGYSF